MKQALAFLYVYISLGCNEQKVRHIERGSCEKVGINVEEVEVQYE